MKLIEKNTKEAKKQERMEDLRKAEREAMNKALEDFRASSAHQYVMKFFKEYEDQLIKEIQSIQTEEMKKIFMLPTKEQRAKLAEMSKRDLILTGTLSIIKRVKVKL